MLKCLFATCLTALSVNTQGLPVSRSIEPSNAIMRDNNDVLLADSSTTLYEKVPLYESNIVSNYSDLVVGNIYALSFYYEDLWSSYITTDYVGEPLTCLSYSILPSEMYLDEVTSPIIYDSSSIVSIYPNFSTDEVLISYFDITNNHVSFYILMGSESAGDSYFIFVLNQDLYDFFSDTDNQLFVGNFIRYTDYQVYEYRAIPSTHNSNLYRLLYDFYYGLFNDSDLSNVSTGYNMSFDNWLAHTCTIATLITLIVVAFFFLRWLFKVISGLILLKR